MKQLNVFIQEKLKISETSFILEKLKIGIDTKIGRPYKYFPETYSDLKDIVDKRINDKKDNIDFNDIDISNLKYIAGIFCYKNELTHIDISKWNVSNVEDMQEMFIGCKNLETIGDISNWNTSKLKDVTGMFYGCSKLHDIGDLDKWNYSKINRKQNMFDLADKIKKPKWY